MQESVIQTKVLNDLKTRDVFSFKIIQANVNGIPDIFFCSQKTGPVFLEMKRSKGGVVSPAQILQMSIAGKHGIKCYVVNTIEEWTRIKKELFNQQGDVENGSTKTETQGVLNSD